MTRTTAPVPGTGGAATVGIRIGVANGIEGDPGMIGTGRDNGQNKRNRSNREARLSPRPRELRPQALTMTCPTGTLPPEKILKARQALR